jgi:hypothetical protein
LAGIPIAATIVAVTAAEVTVATAVAAIAIAVVAIATSIAVAAPVVSAVSPVVAIAAPVVAVATAFKALARIAPVITASAVPVSPTAIVAVVPRASADKDTADKIVRPVETIWCAFVGVVVVVSVRTNGSYADVAVVRNVAGTDSDAHRNLSPRVAGCKHENAE